MRVMICGGTGFIGQALAEALLDRGDEVTIVTRQLPAAPAAGFLYVTWEQWSENPNRWSGVDAIVNLVGETVGQRWTEEAKRRILISRTQTALVIEDIVRRMNVPPAVLVSASGISLYGHSVTPLLKKRRKMTSAHGSALDPEPAHAEPDSAPSMASAFGVQGFSPRPANAAPAKGAASSETAVPSPVASSSGDVREEADWHDPGYDAEDTGVDEEWVSESEANDRSASNSDIEELLRSLQRNGNANDKLRNAGSSVHQATDSSIHADVQPIPRDYGWFDENSPVHPEDYLGQVVVAWEEAVDRIPADRIVKLRIGLVLGRKGGSFPLLRLPYRLFAGGRLGRGTQGLPWIHLYDMVSLILFCLDHPDIEGPINAVAPDPVNNDQFGRKLAKVMRRPHWFHVPAGLARRVLGEQSTLVLTGQHAYPRRALEYGFAFAFPRLEEALRDLT